MAKTSHSSRVVLPAPQDVGGTVDQQHFHGPQASEASFTLPEAKKKWPDVSRGPCPSIGLASALLLGGSRLLCAPQTVVGSGVWRGRSAAHSLLQGNDRVL